MKKINKLKLAKIILDIIIIIGIVGIIFNLGRNYEYKECKQIIEKQHKINDELRELYENKCKDCKERHYTLVDRFWD